jgi:NAD+ kinase
MSLEIHLQAQEEESRFFRLGPPPGDVAEVEAFCRIYRLAEQLHISVMDVRWRLLGLRQEFLS